MMAKIEHLGSRRAEDDNSLWTVPEMLRAVADENCADAESAIVIIRKKGDPNDYHIGFMMANLRGSEAVAMLEIAKAKLANALAGAGK